MNKELLIKAGIHFTEVDGKVIIGCSECKAKSREEYLSADKLSADDFNTAKQVVTDFDPSLWDWSTEEQMYIKVREHVAEEQPVEPVKAPEPVPAIPVAPPVPVEPAEPVKPVEKEEETKSGVCAKLDAANISYKNVNGKILIGHSTTDSKNIKFYNMANVATALADGIPQQPATKDDYIRISKAVTFNAGTYLQNIPGYIFKSVTPADVGIDPAHEKDAQSYLVSSVKDLTNYLTTQMTKYSAPTPQSQVKVEAPKPEPKPEPEQKPKPEAEAQVDDKVRVLVKESCKEFGLEDLCLKITKDKNDNPTFFLNFAGTEILADSDLTFVEDRFDKVKQEVINFVSKIKALVKR